MAQLVTVRLARHDSTPWGFRLQGGKDFGTPLLIQKVNGGSLAEQAGLAVGDGLIKVNGQDVFDLRHKDAQDAIVHGGNSLELQVQRGGGSTWKPLVTSIGSTPSPLPHVSGPPPCVTKTSLAANKYPGKTPLIGSGHNIAPKPFNGLPHSQLNGNANGSVKAIVNKQYNTPVGIYSEETIAETLSAQAEVLAGGVLGVNFKKNEKHYNAQNSEVLKMVQEADAEPRSPEPVQPSSVAYFATSSHAVGGRATSPRPLTPMAQQIAHNSPGSPYVVAKETNVAPTSTVDEPPNCSECGKIVVGVFVRIKDKNLHVECFKCATCGTSLKNVGYYNINNKLYCDIHAKMIARQNPPAPNLEPVTVSPGGRIPSNVVSNAINSAMSPKSNSVSSPFQVRHVPMHVSSPTPTPSQTPSSNILSPKSFNGTSAPLTPPISSNFSPRPQTVRAITTDEVDRSISSLSNSENKNTENTRENCERKQCCVGLDSRGPFITALGKIWCPDHFICVNKDCRRPLQDIGFVEESSGLYCEYCFEQFLAPTCHKCSNKIKGDCLNAIGKHFHPECFKCAFCSKLFGNNPFFLEEGLPYCENDWNELFTTKCFACGFPIEAGDRWVEALNNNYHSPCFNCTMCKKNLEGESFYAKGGRPYCKSHAR